MDGTQPRTRTASSVSGTRPDPRLTTAVLRVVLPVFAVVLAGLAAGHVAFLLFPSRQVLGIFDLSTEASFGTWVGSTLHLLCAALSAVGAGVARRAGSPWVRNWWLLAAVFLLLSVDETAGGHDRLVVPLQERFATSGVLLYPWVVAGLLLGAVLFVVQLRFLRSLGRTGLRLVLAGGVFVLGAAGLEMLEGLVASPGGPGRDTLLYDLLVMAEELMEVGALMWVVCILLTHLLEQASGTRVLVGDAAAAPESTRPPVPVG